MGKKSYVANSASLRKVACLNVSQFRLRSDCCRAEVYHYLCEMAVEMEKLGLNEFTAAAASAPVVKAPATPLAPKTPPASPKKAAVANGGIPTVKATMSPTNKKNAPKVNNSNKPAAAGTSTPSGGAAKKAANVTPGGSAGKKTPNAGGVRGGKVVKRGAAGRGAKTPRGRGGGPANQNWGPSPGGPGGPSEFESVLPQFDIFSPFLFSQCGTGPGH